MNEKKILAYLQEHPEFLLNHAADLGVRPAEGRVQSFAQAQWLAQQKKAAKMAGQLAQIMQDADSNHQTLGRILGDYRLPENHAAHAALSALEEPLCGNRIAPSLMKALPQEGRGLESFLLLPLRVNGQTVAAMVAGDADETRFTPDLPLDWMRELAACTAAALARAGGWQ